MLGQKLGQRGDQFKAGICQVGKHVQIARAAGQDAGRGFIGIDQ